MQVTIAGGDINFLIAAGETVAEAVTIAAGGVLVNLTGYSLKMQINFPSPLLLDTGNSGITTTNATQGAAQINISSATTETFGASSGLYDFWMISGSGVATRLFGGLFSVNSSITPIP